MAKPGQANKVAAKYIVKAGSTLLALDLIYGAQYQHQWREDESKQQKHKPHATLQKVAIYNTDPTSLCQLQCMKGFIHKVQTNI